MISKTVHKLLNEQITHELASSHLYLGMAAYCDDLQLKGMAAWFYGQADEEREHARRIMTYVMDRDHQVTLGALPSVATSYPSPKAAFEAALAHEVLVTSLIYAIAQEAASKNDHTTYSFIQWFLDEQVEEEEQVRAILAKFTFTDNLLLLDQLITR